MKIIEKANLTMSNALFGEKVFRANKTKVSNFDSEVVTDEWTLNKKYTVTPTKDFISKMNITVNVPTVVYPVKGDVINIDMDGDGTAEKYLVLKGSGKIFEVLAQATPSSGTSIKFADSGKTYAENALDTYLNSTYYATLSATAKTALVDKTFTQDSWYNSNTGDPAYNGTYSVSTAYFVSLGSATYGSEITRHIYAISIQDIIDYLGVTPEMTSAESTLNKTNIQTMFNETGSTYIWTRSASAGSDLRAFFVDCGLGYVDAPNATSTYQARPAFTIDLSKITWTPEV